MSGINRVNGTQNQSYIAKSDKQEKCKSEQDIQVFNFGDKNNNNIVDDGDFDESILSKIKQIIPYIINQEWSVKIANLLTKIFNPSFKSEDNDAVIIDGDFDQRTVLFDEDTRTLKIASSPIGVDEYNAYYIERGIDEEGNEISSTTYDCDGHYIDSNTGKTVKVSARLFSDFVEDQGLPRRGERKYSPEEVQTIIKDWENGDVKFSE